MRESLAWTRVWVPLALVVWTLMRVASRLMPTDFIAATSACEAETAGGRETEGAAAAGISSPRERQTRPSRSRMKRVSLWKTGRPLSCCSTRTMRRPLRLLTLSPRKWRASISALVRP